ncbi:DUF6220 domain-containing protein [Microbacterium sp.]|uniref:DUF6220 domain-containing protein n=1 Tax=Microbacterium sp. TaxID=51671 RepID=UPI003C724C25
MRTLRLVFFAVTVLLTIATVFQLYLAAVGTFSHTEEGFSWHGMNGRIVLPILIILTVVFAAVARAGKRTIWLSVSLIGLLLFQTLIFIITGVIFNVGPETARPPAAAILMVSLHALGGLAIIWVSSLLVRRAAALARRTDTGTGTGTGTGTASKAEVADVAASAPPSRS